MTELWRSQPPRPGTLMALLSEPLSWADHCPTEASQESRGKWGRSDQILNWGKTPWRHATGLYRGTLPFFFVLRCILPSIWLALMYIYVDSGGFVPDTTIMNQKTKNPNSFILTAIFPRFRGRVVSCLDRGRPHSFSTMQCLQSLRVLPDLLLF